MNPLIAILAITLLMFASPVVAQKAPTHKAAAKRPAEYAGLKLSLRAIGHVGQGPDMTKWTEVYQYVVENLPSGEQAWIANFGAPYRQNWKILRATGDVQSDWRGDHDSPEAALAVIEEELSGGSPMPNS